MKISIPFDRLRIEEKELKEEAESLGCEVELMDVRSLSFEISRSDVRKGFGDVVFQRCISYHRSLFLTRILENFGVPVINTAAVAEICGNKMLTTMALAKAGVPTPKTFVAMSSDAVQGAAGSMGFPVVLKPFIGSWGRMVSIAKDEQALNTVVELKEELSNPIEHIYYMQEFIKRPPRDIRAIVAGGEIVACVYRHAPENDWRTNVARGGTTSAFKPDKELVETILRAAEAVGGGVLGVDAMESETDGYVIHEVNNTVEFKGAQSATKESIAKKMMSFVISRAKR